MNLTFKVKHIDDDISKIKHLIPLAQKERVPVKKTKAKVEYWVAETDSGEIIGFVGATVNGKKARLKSDFMNPNYRGQGIYSILFGERQQALINRGVTSFSAFCTPMSVNTYIKNGFEVKNKKDGSDIVFVVKEV